MNSTNGGPEVFERDVVKRLRDARDFIGTRMNHPADSSSELKAERPGLMDTLKEAAEIIAAVRERCLEFSGPQAIGSDATPEEQGFFEGHILAHRQIHELTWNPRAER